MAYAKSFKPFADDENEEDFGPKSQGFDDGASDSGWSNTERRQHRLQREVMRTAHSAADSSYHPLGLIHESERMVVEAAEGEALERSNKMLDNMDQHLKINQKVLIRIKSLWDGLINYFKGNPETKRPPEQPSENKTTEDGYQASHSNLIKLNTEGFRAAVSGVDSSSQQNSDAQNGQLGETHQSLDKNLDDLSDDLRRLKNLGLGLKSEIDDQNDSIEDHLNSIEA